MNDNTQTQQPVYITGVQHASIVVTLSKTKKNSQAGLKLSHYGRSQPICPGPQTDCVVFCRNTAPNTTWITTKLRAPAEADWRQFPTVASPASQPSG